MARGAYRLREMHEKLNRSGLEFNEPWPYMPHLTIAKMDTTEEARKVLEEARLRWNEYKDSRTVRIESVTFVKGNGERWVDLGHIALAGQPSK